MTRARATNGQPSPGGAGRRSRFDLTGLAGASLGAMRTKHLVYTVLIVVGVVVGYDYLKGQRTGTGTMGP